MLASIYGWGIFILPKKSSQKDDRIPQPFDNIQVNFCKNPICPNFGIPASTKKQPRGPYAKPHTQDGYIRKTKGGVFHLLCKYCGESFPLKSNQGIAEEAIRFTPQAPQRPVPACKNGNCENFGKGAKQYPHLYSKSGRTAAGSQRYICKSCKSTFSETKKAIARQRKSHLNRYIFKCLMNKVPLKGIADIFGISMDTVYRKINFLYTQCNRFLEAREARLLRGMSLPKMYIAVDRQYYAVNWRVRKDKRNIILYGIASADNNSGYVFSNDVNYDLSLDPDLIEWEAEQNGDYDKNLPFRRYARLWLQKDFIAAVLQAKKNSKREKARLNEAGEILDLEIESRYEALSKRTDIEASEELNEKVQLPHDGMMVRMDYCMYGHFLRLKDLLRGAEKIRFFMDQESGIRAACLSVFHRQIWDRICDAFYVSTIKTMTVDDREDVNKVRKKTLEEYSKLLGVSIKEAELALLTEQVKMMDSFGPWRDRWFTHPLPTYKEPGIKVCHLTDFGDYDITHRAWLYNKASLHSVNTYFANVRRKLSLLERPIATPSSLGRKWFAYSPYNPAVVNKLLLIHRAHYNFVGKRGQKETPAMRLGLAKAPVEPEDIIYSRGLSFRWKKALNERSDNKKEFLKGPEPDSLKEKRASLSTFKPGRPKYLKNLETIYLDTETTGVTLKDQIIEIAIVDDAGETLLNSLVRGTCPVHKDANKLHGLTLKKVAKSPSLKDLEDAIINIVRGKHAVTYNLEFDLRFLTPRIKSAIQYASCCMRAYAEYRNELTEYDTYRWFSLNEASVHLNYEWEGTCHRALPDALACRAVWRKIKRLGA
jgi:DNA polymerase III epsilon subunit-like protein/transposase-like protein